jgi:hypothetical protein
VSSQIIYRQTVEWFANNKLESTWQEVVAAYQSTYSGICSEGLRKTTKISQGKRCPNRYSNQVPEEHKGLYCFTGQLDKYYKFCRQFVQDTGNSSVSAAGCHFFPRWRIYPLALLVKWTAYFGILVSSVVCILSALRSVMLLIFVAVFLKRWNAGYEVSK